MLSLRTTYGIFLTLRTAYRLIKTTILLFQLHKKILEYSVWHAPPQSFFANVSCIVFTCFDLDDLILGL